MHRRGVGVSRVRQNQDTQKRMEDMGQQLEAMKLSHIADHMALLETRLRELSTKHEQQIRRDPILRSKFKQLSDSLGIDMLTSKNNMWSKLLGLGDYYFDLAVMIVEYCIHERPVRGGMIPLKSVLESTKRRRPRDNICTSDILQALEKLRVLGSGYSIVTIGNVQYIQATPDELSTDAVVVLNLAQEKSAAGSPPMLTVMECVQKLRWDSVRAEKALNGLLMDGTAWVDYAEGGAEPAYWLVLLIPM